MSLLHRSNTAPAYGRFPAPRYHYVPLPINVASIGNRTLASTARFAIAKIRDPELAHALNTPSDDLVVQISALFARYDAPIGLTVKLFQLSGFRNMDVIIDDSSSMNTPCAAGGTRWTELQGRISEMCEFVAYVPGPVITLRFLNRRTVYKIARTGSMQPRQFLEMAHDVLNRAFAEPPRGMTPILDCLRESFARGRGQRVARYLMCDGEPSGGAAERAQIIELVNTRDAPEHNPVTLISCSDDDREIAWLKELEESAPFCSEYDDYQSEREEVLRDQGNALPFPYGMYVIGELVGALCPDDLDAMDESIPFSKATFDNLLGIVHSEPEYRAYFEGFCAAQSQRRVESAADELKRTFNWIPAYEELLNCELARNTQLARVFQQQSENIVRQR